MNLSLLAAAAVDSFLPDPLAICSNAPDRTWPFPIPDDDTLVLSVNNHVPVHVICESIDVWWIFILCLGEQENKRYHDQLGHIAHLFSQPLFCGS